MSETQNSSIQISLIEIIFKHNKYNKYIKLTLNKRKHLMNVTLYNHIRQESVRYNTNLF